MMMAEKMLRPRCSNRKNHWRFELQRVYCSKIYDYHTVSPSAMTELVFTREYFWFLSALFIVHQDKLFQGCVALSTCFLIRVRTKRVKNLEMSCTTAVSKNVMRITLVETLKEFKLESYSKNELIHKYFSRFLTLIVIQLRCRTLLGGFYSMLPIL